MKLPPKNSRGRAILESLLLGPVTIYQGIERHGAMNSSEALIRRLYEQLVLSGCATRLGVIYQATPEALAALDPQTEEGEITEQVEALPAGPRYAADWRASTLSANSARRMGCAYGFNGERP